MVLEVVFSTNDEETYSLGVIQRVARRQGLRPDVPGIVFLEIDGRAPGPATRDAGRQCAEHGPLAVRGHAPADRVGAGSLLADRREPGRILLGSNEDAFRWVERRPGR